MNDLQQTEEQDKWTILSASNVVKSTTVFKGIQKNCSLLCEISLMK